MRGKTVNGKGTARSSSKEIAYNEGYVPHSYHGENQGHKKQPKGNKSTGVSTKRDWRKLNEAAGEGKQHGYHEKPVAYIPDGRKNQGHPADHSKLAFQGNYDSRADGGHASQPGGGRAKGENGGGGAGMGRMGPAFEFRTGHMAQSPHGFRHEGGLKQGALRLSGHPGAHMIGCRKKGR